MGNMKVHPTPHLYILCFVDLFARNLKEVSEKICVAGFQNGLVGMNHTQGMTEDCTIWVLPNLQDRESELTLFATSATTTTGTRSVLQIKP